jgi:serine protease Do
MMPKHAIPLILILSLVLTHAHLFAETEGSLKLQPLPAVELEKVISGWLTHSGFEISAIRARMGQVQLSAVKAKECWQIALKPHSALATQVHARYAIDGQPHEAHLERLWDYIAGYMSGPTKESSPEPEAPDQAIPIAVLSQVESVVCIKARSGDNNIQFSGFAVEEDGLIICTAHDLKNLQEITVILYDGRQLKANLVKMDTHRDLALLDINAKFDTFISVAEGRNLLGMGESLYSVGCPIDLRGTIYSGIINSPPRRVNDLPLWQVNMHIHPGSSGSPVFDVQGNLVAIVKGRYRGTDSVGFLIPLETIIDFATDT